MSKHIEWDISFYKEEFIEIHCWLELPNYEMWNKNWDDQDINIRLYIFVKFMMKHSVQHTKYPFP